MKKEQLRKRGCAAKVTLSDGESFYKILRKNLWNQCSVCVTIKSAREIFLKIINEDL